MPHQMALLKSQYPMDGIIGGRGSGKSVIVAILAAMAFNANERVLVLAQTNKAISENIFREILYWLDSFQIKYKSNQSNMTIDNGNDGRIITGSYEALDSLRGLTRISLLICDEIFYSPPNLFEVLAPCLRGEGITPRIRFASSPAMHSWFCRYIRENNVHYIACTTYDNSFLTEASLKLMEKSMRNETLRRQELLGEILDGAVDNAILSTKDFPERANDAADDSFYWIGVDCSGFGRDQNAVVIRTNRQIKDIYTIQTTLSDTLAAWIENKIHRYGDLYLKGIWIDLAYGQALYERLYNKFPTKLISFAAKASRENFMNIRAEMYFNVSDSVRDGFFVDDSDLRYDLCNTTFCLKNERLAIDKKEVIKAIIGHSPDVADALALTFAEPENITPNYSENAEKGDGNYYARWMGGDF